VPRHPDGARRRGRAGRERGSSAIELVLVTPVLIALVFTVIQAALVWHARHVALAAAQQGDRIARAAAPASTEAVRADTVAYLQTLGADLLAAPGVTVTRSGGYATVSVTGQAVSLIPGANLRVTGMSRGPVERFVPDIAGFANSAAAGGGG
jgi:Flp pilus assembly protein TadG